MKVFRMGEGRHSPSGWKWCGPRTARGGERSVYGTGASVPPRAQSWRRGRGGAGGGAEEGARRAGRSGGAEGGAKPSADTLMKL